MKIVIAGLILLLTSCIDVFFEVRGGPCDPYWDYTILGWIQEESQEKLLFQYSYLTEDIPQNATDSEKGKYYDTQYYTVNRDGTDLKTRPEFKELMSGKGYSIIRMNFDQQSLLVSQLEEPQKERDSNEKVFGKIYKILSINLINKTVTDLNFKASRNELSRMQLSPDGKFLIYSPDRKTEKEEDMFQLVNTQTGEEKKITLLIEETNQTFNSIDIKLINLDIKQKLGTIFYYSIKTPDKESVQFCSYGTIDKQTSTLNSSQIYDKNFVTTIKDVVYCDLIGGTDDKVLYLTSRENDVDAKIFEHHTVTNEIKQIANLRTQNTYYRIAGFQRLRFTSDLQQVAHSGISGIAISNIDGSNQHTLVSLKQLPRKGVNVPECLQLSFP